jgi:hypothetical protein
VLDILCTILPIQHVYDVLDICLCFPLQVEHYNKFARLDIDYDQNPIKVVHIDIQAYIHVIDLIFI